MTKKTGVIVQARMGSTRLPGKMLFPLAGKPVLEQVLARLRRCQAVDHVIVATSVEPKDDPIAAWADWLEVPCFRGNEEDVLERFYLAAVEHRLDVILRVCADCPLIDSDLTDAMVRRFHELNALHEPCDYLTNILERTYPRGLDVEVFSFDALKKAHLQDTNPQSREGVTVFIFTHKDQFVLYNYSGEQDYSCYRWTLDTVDDYRLLCKIYNALYLVNPAFAWTDVVRLLETHPEWTKINAQVRQREVFLRTYKP